jgi:hypothetical protein
VIDPPGPPVDAPVLRYMAPPPVEPVAVERVRVPPVVVPEPVLMVT